MPMNEDDEERIAAHLAKTMAMMCVRNTMIEDIHAGLTPVTRTGDYSDVMVIDADGRKGIVMYGRPRCCKGKTDLNRR